MAPQLAVVGLRCVPRVQFYARGGSVQARNVVAKFPVSCDARLHSQCECGRVSMVLDDFRLIQTTAFATTSRDEDCGWSSHMFVALHAKPDA